MNRKLSTTSLPNLPRTLHADKHRCGKKVTQSMVFKDLLSELWDTILNQGYAGLFGSCSKDADRPDKKWN